MKEEKFKIINFIRNFIIQTEKEMDNFPKKDIEIKNQIRNLSFELLEISYEANATMSIEQRIRLLEKAIAKVKVIDFLLNLSYDKQIISNKKYIKLGLIMDDIIKYISGWLSKAMKESKAQLAGWARRIAMLTLTMRTGECIMCMLVGTSTATTCIIRSAMLTRLGTVCAPQLLKNCGMIDQGNHREVLDVETNYVFYLQIIMKILQV